MSVNKPTDVDEAQLAETLRAVADGVDDGSVRILSGSESREADAMESSLTKYSVTLEYAAESDSQWGFFEHHDSTGCED